MSSNLKLLVASRKLMRSQVTRHYNDRNNFCGLSGVERSALTVKLKGLKVRLSDTDEKILPLKWKDEEDEAQLEVELSSCQEYEYRIVEMLSLLEKPVTVSESRSVHETAHSLLKSPVAPLPRFTSAEGENLELFLRQFEETTGKFSYTQYDKLLLLKQQISGKALVLIDSLEADKQSYSHAKSLLQSAFASVSTQKFNVLSKLSTMTLGYNDEPFEYVSDIGKIQESVKTLNLDVHDVMQYFSLKGMNATFKNQLIQITNHNKPTVDEITKHFFDANERYQSVRSSKAKKVSVDGNISSKPGDSKVGNTTTLANNFNVKSNPFKSCTVCSDVTSTANHSISKCTKYKSDSDKVQKLQQLNGCVKCASITHRLRIVLFVSLSVVFTVMDGIFHFCAHLIVNSKLVKQMICSLVVSPLIQSLVWILKLKKRVVRKHKLDWYCWEQHCKAMTV